VNLQKRNNGRGTGKKGGWAENGIKMEINWSCCLQRFKNSGKKIKLSRQVPIISIAFSPKFLHDNQHG
jgi:hypothetical protein